MHNFPPARDFRPIVRAEEQRWWWRWAQQTTRVGNAFRNVCQCVSVWPCKCFSTRALDDLLLSQGQTNRSSQCGWCHGERMDGARDRQYTIHGDEFVGAHASHLVTMNIGLLPLPCPSCHPIYEPSIHNSPLICETPLGERASEWVRMFLHRKVRGWKGRREPLQKKLNRRNEL